MPTSRSPSPASTDIEDTPESLRNPGLARAVPRGRSVEGGSAGDAGNAASNGYWTHDDVGPRHYVAQEAGASGGVAPATLISAIEERLGSVSGLDASRVHISVEAGGVVLSGYAEDAEARRRIGACAVSVAGALAVANRIKLAGA